MPIDVLTTPDSTRITGAVNITNDPNGNAGILTVAGGLTALTLGITSAAQTPLTGAAQTVTTASAINRTLPTGAVTTAILTKGTQNGQVIIVTNESQTVANTITFDVPANSFVWTDGTNPQVLKAGTGKMFVWIASLQAGVGAWVPLAPFAG